MVRLDQKNKIQTQVVYKTHTHTAKPYRETLEIKGWKKTYHKNNQKEGDTAILMSNKMDFKEVHTTKEEITS